MITRSKIDNIFQFHTLTNRFLTENSYCESSTIKLTSSYCIYKNLVVIAYIKTYKTKICIQLYIKIEKLYTIERR